MIIRDIEVPTAATSLLSLLANNLRTTAAIGLQAPASNAGTVFFGDQHIQPFELRAKANAFLPVNITNPLYIRGSSGDRLSVVLF